jgi:hypothetical protein
VTAQNRHVIAVVGPPSAGVTSLAEVLAVRLPEHAVIDASSAGEPDAVVFVASAVAPLVDSDLDLFQSASARTDLVVAAVSKIDAHRRWRDVLAADRALAVGRDGRHLRTPWVGVAAAPDLGDPNVDLLVDTLRAGLAEPDLAVRNEVRAHRTDPIRGYRPSKSADALAIRVGIQRTRLTLVYFARRRCGELGEELRVEAAELARGAAARMQAGVRGTATDFVAAIDETIGRAVEDVAGTLRLTPPDRPAAPPSPRLPALRPSARRLESRLMMVLGAGFGLGVALTLSRLTSQLGDGFEAIGLLAGGGAGLLLTIWVVGIRGVLHDRALMDRWVGEVASTLRSCAEEMIARRLLEAEIAFTAELADRASGPKSRLGKSDLGTIARTD